MSKSNTPRKGDSFRTGVPSEATIAMMQVLLTELSTTAFVSSIIATICFPNLLSPAGQWSTFDWWVTDGNDPTAPVTDGRAYALQLIYGLLWCFASMNALMSVIASLGLGLSVIARAHSADELNRLVAFYKRIPTAVYVTRSWPRPLRLVAEPLIDFVLFLCAGGMSYRSNFWSMPYAHLLGSSIFLVLAETYNIYFLVPSYLWAHAVCCVVGVPICYLYIRTGQTGGADVDEEEAREKAELLQRSASNASGAGSRSAHDVSAAGTASQRGAATESEAACYSSEQNSNSAAAAPATNVITADGGCLQLPPSPDVYGESSRADVDAALQASTRTGAAARGGMHAQI